MSDQVDRTVLPIRRPPFKGVANQRAVARNSVNLGPAITFALADFILLLALAVEIGHRAGTTTPPSAP